MPGLARASTSTTYVEEGKCGDLLGREDGGVLILEKAALVGTCTISGFQRLSADFNKKLATERTSCIGKADSAGAGRGFWRAPVRQASLRGAGDS